MSGIQMPLFYAAKLRLERSALDNKIKELERESSIATFRARQGNWLRKYSSNHQQTISDAAVAAACAAKEEADLQRALDRWTDDLATTTANLTQADVAYDYALKSVERSRANLYVEASVDGINQLDMDRAYARYIESHAELQQALFDRIAASNALKAQEAVPPPLRRD